MGGWEIGNLETVIYLTAHRLGVAGVSSLDDSPLKRS